MKNYIRTLWADDERRLWYNKPQREAVRNYLNDHGFYVLTGVEDSLDVYVIDYSEPLDILICRKSLDKLAKVWYTLTRPKKLRR